MNIKTPGTPLIICLAFIIFFSYVLLIFSKNHNIEGIEGLKYKSTDPKADGKSVDAEQSLVNNANSRLLSANFRVSSANSRVSSAQKVVNDANTKVTSAKKVEDDAHAKTLSAQKVVNNANASLSSARKVLNEETSKLNLEKQNLDKEKNKLTTVTENAFLNTSWNYGCNGDTFNNSLNANGWIWSINNCKDKNNDNKVLPCNGDIFKNSMKANGLNWSINNCKDKNGNLVATPPK